MLMESDFADTAESSEVLFDEPLVPVKLCEIVPKPKGLGFFNLRPYQDDCVDAIFRELNHHQSTMIVLPTGCHAKGQGILRWDGTVALVEDIAVGDLLMGPDGDPRRVLQLARGRGEMVKIVPIKGRSFVVNKDHILTLVRTPASSSGKYPSQSGGVKVDVSVREWMGWSKWKKHTHKLFRVPQDFDFKQHPIPPVDPYLLGVILGDGSLAIKNSSIAICSCDPEIVSAVNEYAFKHQLQVRYEKYDGKAPMYYLHGGCGVVKNPLQAYLKRVGLKPIDCDQRFVPHEYKVNTRYDRRQILAGLIDSDGSLTNGCYDYISKSYTLAHDVAFIARSLGLAAYVEKCRKYCQTGASGNYYRVSISGDIDQIPVRVARKKSSPRRQKKSVLRTGFHVEELPEDDYYGFTLDGDGRYCLDDFTVTHNTGKTVCALAETAIRWPDHLGRVLIIAHTEELIDQAAEKVGIHLDETTGIEMGERKESPHPGLYGRGAPKVLVASIQTLSREKRRHKIDPKSVGLIVYDECHHSMSKSAREVLTYFIQGNPQVRIVGPTATPKRGDKKALGDLYRTVAYQMDIATAIRDGWLVDIEQKLVIVEGLDFGKCRMSRGDMNQDDLASVMMGGSSQIISGDELTPLQQDAIQQQEKMIHAIVKPSIEEAAGRPTLVFCVTKAHAALTAEIFNRYVPSSAMCITDATPKDERKEILSRFRAGHFQFLVNVNVLSEGYDSLVDVVVNAAPTKSISRYIQRIGRGTRPLPGIVDNYDTASERRNAIIESKKPRCTVLDFTGDATEHNICTILDVLGGEYDEDVIDAALAKLGQGNAEVVTDLLKKTKEEIEEEKKQQALKKAEREKAAKERADREREEREREAARREKIRAEVQYRTETINMRPTAVVPNIVGVGLKMGGATEKQIKWLMKLGVAEDKACGFNKSQAGAVIDKLQSQTGKDFIITFGKHAGNKLGDLPSSYVSWLNENFDSPQVKENIQLMRSGQ